MDLIRIIRKEEVTVIREAQKHIKEKAYEIATLSKKLRDEIRSNKLYRYRNGAFDR